MAEHRIPFTNAQIDRSIELGVNLDEMGSGVVQKLADGTLSNATITTSSIGAVPTSRTVNSKALSSNISLTAADVGAVPTTRTVNGKALSANISLTAANVGAVPTTRTINGKPLSEDINITAADFSGVANFAIVSYDGDNRCGYSGSYDSTVVRWTNITFPFQPKIIACLGQRTKESNLLSEQKMNYDYVRFINCTELSNLTDSMVHERDRSSSSATSKIVQKQEFDRVMNYDLHEAKLLIDGTTQTVPMFTGDSPTYTTIYSKSGNTIKLAITRSSSTATSSTYSKYQYNESGVTYYWIAFA